MKTKRMSINKSKTRKNNYSMQTIQKFEQEVVIKFLSLLNNVKIYHWKTQSYATHKATDDLYAQLNTHIDSFIEVLLGKIGNRIDLSKIKSLPIYNFNTQDQLKKYITDFKKYLVTLNSNKVMNIMSNSDLYNIRDEILGDLNQFLYLLTFK